MSVHNEPKSYINTSIQSIRNQSYNNIEIILINDASNEETTNYLISLAETDKRIKLIHNSENLGLTRSLNEGLKLCNGEFIARMDADDYSLPTRIERQVKFLLKNHQIDILGTGVVSFGSKVMYMSPLYGANPDEIQNYLFFSSGLCHPSVMIKKEFINKYNLTYNNEIKKAQDYDLWERASVYGNLAVISKVLLFYRMHESQISFKNSSEQEETSESIKIRRLKRINITPNLTELNAHKALNNAPVKVQIEDIESWIAKLLSASQYYTKINISKLKKDLFRRLTLYKLKNKEKLNNFDFLNIIYISYNRFMLAIWLLYYKSITRKIK